MMSQNPKFLNAVTNAKLFHFHHFMFLSTLMFWLHCYETDTFCLQLRGAFKDVTLSTDQKTWSKSKPMLAAFWFPMGSKLSRKQRKVAKVPVKKFRYASTGLEMIRKWVRKIDQKLFLRFKSWTQPRLYDCELLATMESSLAVANGHMT